VNEAALPAFCGTPNLIALPPQSELEALAIRYRQDSDTLTKEEKQIVNVAIQAKRIPAPWEDRPTREPGLDVPDEPGIDPHRCLPLAQAYAAAAPKPSPTEQALAELRAWRDGGRAESQNGGFQPLTALLTREIPQPLWVARGLVPEGAVAVIAGEPKGVKSWAVQDIGMAVASGTPAFGEYEVKQRRAVALFAAEDSERSIRARARSLAAARGLEPSVAVAHMYYRSRASLDLSKLESVAQLMADVRALPEPIGLLIIDPLRDCTSADENESGPMAQTMASLRALRDLLGCTILFVHHVSKLSKDNSERRPGQRMRGSSAIHGAVDAGIYLSNLKTDGCSWWTTTVTVELRAARGAGIFGLKLELEDDEHGEAVSARWTLEREGDSDSGASDHRDTPTLTGLAAKVIEVLQNAGRPLGRDAIRSRIGVSAAQAAAVLAVAESEGLVRHQIRGWELVPGTLTGHPDYPDSTLTSQGARRDPDYPDSLPIGSQGVGSGSKNPDSGGSRGPQPSQGLAQVGEGAAHGP
jgi:hypothetical protein